jgi:hypothetical protein
MFSYAVPPFYIGLMGIRIQDEKILGSGSRMKKFSDPVPG